MDLFRGYIRTNGKAATEPFKNLPDEELRTFAGVKNLNSYAGVLAEDTILLDVDDHDESEIFMRIVEEKQLLCRVYETKRGKHFYFKNSGVNRNATGALLACGIHADIKTGARASYGTLKNNGVERPIIYDILDGEEYQPLPKYFYPVKSKSDFLNMENGDGRNQALFNYILTLQSNGFTKEEARETLHIINNYVISDPLTEKELETLSRDEAFQQPIFFDGKTFLFNKFAAFLVSEYHIIRINGQLHIYDDGVYKLGYERIESAMIKHIPTLTKSRRAEVISYIELLCCNDVEMSDARYIAFRNGIYDLETDTLQPFTPDIVITNKINWNYNPSAECADVDNALNKLAVGDEKVLKLLHECIGYCFYRRNELRKSFMLTGEKRNGKSTFLSLIENLLGRENCTSLDLKELGDRFKTAELFGKLANIGDDIGDEFIPNPAVFKKLCSGNTINAERKGRDPFDFNNYSKLLFSANNIPRIKDKTGAVISRLVIIPFNAVFDKNDPDYDPYIKYKLQTENAMEHLINLGLDGLRRVLHNYAFTESENVQQALQEYEEFNNPILLFFKDINRDELLNNSTRDAYLRYQTFCAENNFNAMSNIEFSKKVKQKFGVEIADKKINGKKYRVFVEGKTS